MVKKFLLFSVSAFFAIAASAQIINSEIKESPFLLLNGWRDSTITREQFFSIGITGISNLKNSHRSNTHPFDFSIYFSGVGFPFVVVAAGMLDQKMSLPDSIINRIAVGTQITLVSSDNISTAPIAKSYTLVGNKR